MSDRKEDEEIGESGEISIKVPSGSSSSSSKQSDKKKKKSKRESKDDDDEVRDLFVIYHSSYTFLCSHYVYICCVLCVCEERIMRVLVVTISLRLFFDRSKSSVVASLSNLSIYLSLSLIKRFHVHTMYICCVLCVKR